MTKEILFFIAALLAGAATSTQAGVNSQLNLITKSPTITALISFLVGTAALLVYVLVFNYNTLPSSNTLLQIKWWKYSGGLLGVFFITAVVIVAPKIGAANTVGFIIAGQLIFAVIYDHFGWIGFPVKPISLYRLLGVALMIVGVYLIRKF